MEMSVEVAGNLFLSVLTGRFCSSVLLCTMTSEGHLCLNSVPLGRLA